MCGDNGFNTQTDVVCFESSTLRSTNLMSVTEILNIDYIYISHPLYECIAYISWI